MYWVRSQVTYAKCNGPWRKSEIIYLERLGTFRKQGCKDYVNSFMECLLQMASVCPESRSGQEQDMGSVFTAGCSWTPSRNHSLLAPPTTGDNCSGKGWFVLAQVSSGPHCALEYCYLIGWVVGSVQLEVSEEVSAWIKVICCSTTISKLVLISWTCEGTGWSSGYCEGKHRCEYCTECGQNSCWLVYTWTGDARYLFRETSGVGGTQR